MLGQTWQQTLQLSKGLRGLELILLGDEMSTATGKPCTVKELIKLLIDCDQDKEVYLFAAGDNYPACIVQENEGDVEIGGGWESVDLSGE